MKGFYYLFATIAVVAFGAALFGYTHQAYIGCLSGLMAVVCKPERDEKGGV